MTGRELILYILENGLEDEPIYDPSNGSLVGFLTVSQAAVKFNVSTPTILTWIALGELDAIKLGEEFYIPAYSKRPIETDNS